MRARPTRRQTPWILGLTACALQVGCGWGECHDYGAWLYASTDEYLVTDSAAPDWRDPPTVLTVGASGAAYLDSYDETLVHVEGLGFTIDGGDASVAEWQGDGIESFQPSFMTLTFALTGPVELAPIDVSADAPEVELWNGWTLQLAWDEPDGICK